MLFTFVANRKLHSVSPRCAARGDKLHIISVLLEPIQSISDCPLWIPQTRYSPDKLVWSNLVNVEFR